MPVIDKKMFETIKKWWDCSDESIPVNQRIMYINSNNRSVTKSTIRKIMYEIVEEEPYGELYVTTFSAKNFYDNMRDYYMHVAELYFRDVNDDMAITDIIKKYPSTCGWIVLIVEDVESLSNEAEKLKDLFETILNFGCKGASIVLVGNGDYKEVFADCEFALQQMNIGLSHNGDEDKLLIGCYKQEPEVIPEPIIYESADKQCDELEYYWGVFYEQLERKFFDYEYYKSLYKDTLDYILPRVTSERVYRSDLFLIEKIGKLRLKEIVNINGCEPWEFDSAKQFANGLFFELADVHGTINEHANGNIEIGIVVEGREEKHGGFRVRSSSHFSIIINSSNISREMDELSEQIHKRTYNGEDAFDLSYMLNHLNDDERKQMNSEQLKEVSDSLNSFMEDINKSMNTIVNKEPGIKVRRYKGEQGDENTK